MAAGDRVINNQEVYSVVEFLQTQEVELVPTLWVSGGHCCWPSSPRGMALHQAIKNGTEPDHNWDRWEVCTMFTTESYEEGCRKAKEAKMTSDLHSEAEACGQRPIRRKKKSVRLGPLGGLEGVDSEEDRPSPPSKKLSPAPIIQPPSTVPVTQPPNPPPTYTELTTTNSGPLAPTSFSEMLHTWKPGNEVPPELQTNINQGDTRSLLKEVLTKLDMVLDQQTTILRLLQHREAQGSVVEHIEGLPLQDLSQLLSLEQRLQNPDYKEKMVNYLGVTGGADLRDITWRVLKKTISNALARKLNWRGIDGKTSLASLQLREVIIVRRNPLAGVAAEAEVEGIMKRWLQLAADREGRRKRRLLAKENTS
ncbi:hypothetical protein MATL_G00227070 [Megalops atlanticus]|uniref:DUF4806 domain-containing protein n=1 Tax=Megalops atlanticus TaxID=7932 RepID=A0A9D3SWQ4_MEGAT|nr:hypothetical protein MATL_G00227070 [Megalops atlanticus]